jgi:hypothetical protein
MIPPTPEALLDQVAAAIWSTDADLILTRVRAPWLPLPGVKAEDLVGGSLDLLLEGSTLAEVIDAHRASLAGQVAAFDVTWGARRFVGRIAPLRDGAGAIVGAAGVALETRPSAADILDDLEVRPADRPARQSLLADDGVAPQLMGDDVLASVCLRFGWDGGLLWSVGIDERLTCVGRFGFSAADEQSTEPYAWLTATATGQQWIEAAGMTMVPLRVPGSDRRFVLGLLRAGDTRPAQADADRTAAIMAMDLAVPARPAPRAVARLKAPLGAALKLALCLFPLPFIVSACFPPP